MLYYSRDCPNSDSFPCWRRNRGRNNSRGNCGGRSWGRGCGRRYSLTKCPKSTINMNMKNNTSTSFRKCPLTCWQSRPRRREEDHRLEEKGPFVVEDAVVHTTKRSLNLKSILYFPQRWLSGYRDANLTGYATKDSPDSVSTTSPTRAPQVGHSRLTQVLVWTRCL